MKNNKVKEGYALVLRTNDRNNQSCDYFQYPETGYIEAPDWQPTNECGNGLHGALKGVGDSSLLKWDSDAIWMVLEVKEDEIIDLGGKVKFKGGEVIYSGTRQKVIQFLYEIYGNIGIIGLDYHSDREVIVVGGDYSRLTGGDKSTLTGGYGSNLTGGDKSTLTGGYGSNLTGGDWSTLTGGNWSTQMGGIWSTIKGGDKSILTGGYGSTLTGGYGSTLTGGDWSTLTGDYGSTLTGGYGSTLTGGDKSTLTGGYGSTLTGGDKSTLTGGDGSTLTGGDKSTLTGGDGSTLTGGDYSILNFRYWDGNRYRIRIAYVGEDGIKANTKYRLNDNFEIEEVK